MDEFTSISQLTTTAGATAVALLAVQVGKSIIAGTRRLWRPVALIASTATILTGHWLAGTLTPATAVLGVLNGALAGVAAMGVYDLHQERRIESDYPDDTADA